MRRYPEPVRMREYREAANMTRADVAAKTRLSASLVGKIESGRFIPYDNQLVRIADALKVDNPDVLLEPLEVG